MLPPSVGGLMLSSLSPAKRPLWTILHVYTLISSSSMVFMMTLFAPLIPSECTFPSCYTEVTSARECPTSSRQTSKHYEENIKSFFLIFVSQSQLRSKWQLSFHLNILQPREVVLDSKHKGYPSWQRRTTKHWQHNHTHITHTFYKNLLFLLTWLFPFCAS